MRFRVLVLLLALASPDPGAALASTGVCDANPPTSTQACLNAIQAAGAVVNDIFRDTNGQTADQLAVAGRLIDNWPGCPDAAPFAGCSGQSQPPYDCPGQFTCSTPANTYANAGLQLNAVDRGWWTSCRLTDASLAPTGAGGALCPNFNSSCIADGTAGNYIPWEGLVFDLGAHANKVALFAANPNTPQP